MQEAQFSRVYLLMQQRRYEDAENALRGVLAQDPDNATALMLMAVVLYDMDRDEHALGAINAAMRLEPESGRIHAWKSRILLALHKPDEALKSAERAIALAPDDPFSLTAKAAVHASRRQWKESEAACRAALALDPDDEGAHHFLSQALLYTGRAHENESNISSRLADNPENALAHCNAGFAALRRGDHRKASEHFREALRLDASSKMARDGLIESFRSRSRMYRAYLAFAFRIAALSEKMGVFLFIGILFIYRITRAALNAVDPRLSTAFMVLYLMFVFWTYVARGLSTFFLLTDRFARHALHAREKWEASIVGGGFAGGFLIFVTALIMDHPALLLTGGALLAQSIPAAVFFERDGRTGRLLYGSLAAVVWVCAAITIAGVWTPFVPESFFVPVLQVGVLTVMGTTLLAMFGVAKR